ncbi:MAG TPA: hypothetical protein VJI67_01270 [archaeon]|nr:hypothetical protein [archaeon]HLD81154.1 hypothetical protein [archaeon]
MAIENKQKLVVPWQLRREYERYQSYKKQGQDISVSAELKKFLVDLEYSKK